MRYDKFGVPVYNSCDLFDLIYQGNSDKITEILVDLDQEIRSLKQVSNLFINEYVPDAVSIQEFDKKSQNVWYMPDEYKNFDIEHYVLSLIDSDAAKSRVLEELNEYKNRNMLDLLRWLKYFVDHSLKNDILWGVGRGSSVASYILYLIGVHHIDSIKYNLDWREFLR